MNFFKKKQYKQQEETQIEFKNVPSDLKFNPKKEYYGVIFFEGSSKLLTHETTQRSLAIEYFNDIAHSYNGNVEVVGVLK